MMFPKNGEKWLKESGPAKNLYSAMFGLEKASHRNAGAQLSAMIG